MYDTSDSDDGRNLFDLDAWQAELDTQLGELLARALAHTPPTLASGGMRGDIGDAGSAASALLDVIAARAEATLATLIALAREQDRALTDDLRAWALAQGTRYDGPHGGDAGRRHMF